MLATAAGPLFFVLGVFTQSADYMDLWKSRGVNTLVQAPQGHEVLPWARAADDRGLYQIRAPSSDLRFDIADPRLLAWATRDEPSDSRLVLTYLTVAQTPAAVLQQAAPWRAAAKAAGRFVPVWTNHVGPHISPDWARDNALMRDYMDGPESDWLAADAYPVQNREPLVVASNEGYASTVQGLIVDRQLAWSHGKPVMSFVGTSAFGERTAAPTVAQFNAMAWSSVIHGACGVIYFPVRLSPWSFDATPPEIVRALTDFDAQVSALNPVLMAPAGGRSPSVVYRAASPGAAPRAGQLPYPFEAVEIATKRGPYRIVLNLGDRDQVLDKPEWGLSKALFHGYEVRRGYSARPPRG